MGNIQSKLLIASAAVVSINAQTQPLFYNEWFGVGGEAQTKFGECLVATITDDQLPTILNLINVGQRYQHAAEQVGGYVAEPIFVPQEDLNELLASHVCLDQGMLGKMCFKNLKAALRKYYDEYAAMYLGIAQLCDAIDVLNVGRDDPSKLAADGTAINWGVLDEFTDDFCVQRKALRQTVEVRFPFYAAKCLRQTMNMMMCDFSEKTNGIANEITDVIPAAELTVIQMSDPKDPFSPLKAHFVAGCANERFAETPISGYHPLLNYRVEHLGTTGSEMLSMVNLYSRLGCKGASIYTEHEGVFHSIAVFEAIKVKVGELVGDGTTSIPIGDLRAELENETNDKNMGGTQNTISEIRTVVELNDMIDNLIDKYTVILTDLGSKMVKITGQMKAIHITYANAIQHFDNDGDDVCAVDTCVRVEPAIPDDNSAINFLGDGAGHECDGWMFLFQTTGTFQTDGHEIVLHPDIKLCVCGTSASWIAILQDLKSKTAQGTTRTELDTDAVAEVTVAGISFIKTAEKYVVAVEEVVAATVIRDDTKQAAEDAVNDDNYVKLQSIASQAEQKYQDELKNQLQGAENVNAAKDDFLNSQKLLQQFGAPWTALKITLNEELSKLTGQLATLDDAAVAVPFIAQNFDAANAQFDTDVVATKIQISLMQNLLL